MIKKRICVRGEPKTGLGESHGFGSRWLVPTFPGTLPSHTPASEEASTCSRKESMLRQLHRQGVDEITKGATGVPW